VKPGPVGNALITPDGTRIVTVTTSGRVTEISTATGRPVSHPGRGSYAPLPAVWDVLWTSRDGATLIVQAASGRGPALGILSRGRFAPLPGAAVTTDNVAW
jgi:hypothetical protein